MAWPRASSQAVPSSAAGAAPTKGRTPGLSAQTVASRPVSVARPRHQSRVPICAPRSGAQSIAPQSIPNSPGVRTAGRAPGTPGRRTNGRAAVPPASS